MKLCKKCGQELKDNINVCPVCHADNTSYTKVCPKCNAHYTSIHSFCAECGSSLVDGEYTQREQSGSYNYNNNQSYGPNQNQKSRVLAGVLGIVLGGYGVHNFYLGFTTKAILQIIVTFVTCGLGAIWGFVEGILILCHKINVDASNLPLKDDC